MINNSAGQKNIRLSTEVMDAMNEFRSFMFEKVYYSPVLEPERKKAKYVLQHLFEYYCDNPEKLPLDYISRQEKWGVAAIVVDYIAGLTDVYAVQLFNYLFVPNSQRSISLT